MKLLNLHLIVLAVVCSACNKDNLSSGKIELDHDKVTMRLGQTAQVQILSSKNKIVISSAEQSIVAAEIKNNTILFCATNKVGVVDFILTDKSQNYENRRLQVIVQGISGGWKSTHADIYIEAENDAKEKIKQDIERAIGDLHILGFNTNGSALSIINTFSEHYQAGYNMQFPNIDLMYNNEIMRFNVVFIGNMDMQLSQDLTDKYATQHLNQKIVKVKIVLNYTYITL